MYGSTQPDDLYRNTRSALTSPYTPTTTDLETFPAQRYLESAFADYASLEFPSEGSNRSTFDDPPWSAVSTRRVLSHVADPMPDELDMLCESPGAMCYNKELDTALEDLDFSPSMLENSLALNPEDWLVGRTSDRLFYHADKGTDAGSGTAPSVFSCESTISTCATEPTSSMPSPVPVATAAYNRREQMPTASCGSRTEDLSLYSSSEPRKYRRIDPIKLAKARTQDENEHYRCAICDSQFTLRKDLERHRLSKHTDRPSWFCPVRNCPFAVRGFKRKDKAYQHMRTHKRESNDGLEPRLNTEDETHNDIYLRKGFQ